MCFFKKGADRPSEHTFFRTSPRDLYLRRKKEIKERKGERNGESGERRGNTDEKPNE